MPHVTPGFLGTIHDGGGVLNFYGCSIQGVLLTNRISVVNHVFDRQSGKGSLLSASLL